MVKKISVFCFIAICLLGLSSCSSIPYEDVPVELTEDVYRIASLTNRFRAGREAYYINEDNKTTTSMVGKCGYLVLDEDLCKIAAVRAREICTSFSHTRPNGKKVSSVALELNYRCTMIGENLAAGQRDADATFLQWKEDGLEYDLQGHRRNMLRPEFKRIGIAYYHYPENKYQHFWVMVLSD